MWLKILLYAAGRLPEGYRHGTGGFDELLISTLGIDSADLVAYVESEKPGYLQFEAWVKAHARNLSPESVAALNEMILTRDTPAEMAVERRERLGIADPALAHAVSITILTTGTRRTEGSQTKLLDSGSWDRSGHCSLKGKGEVGRFAITLVDF